MYDVYTLGVRNSPNYLVNKNDIGNVVGCLIIAFFVPVMLISAFSPTTGKAFTAAFIIPGVPPF